MKILDLETGEGVLGGRVRDVSKPLGEREAIRPVVEVGGKLSTTNLHEVRVHLLHALRAGFKKRELLIFRSADGRCQLFMLSGFCMKYVSQYPDMVGELLDRGQWLADKGLDRDMLYVSVTSRELGTYEIGVLDQPKRAVYSTPNARGNRKARRAGLV